jgi:inorganic pyrophosphatase
MGQVIKITPPPFLSREEQVPNYQDVKTILYKGLKIAIFKFSHLKGNKWYQVTGQLDRDKTSLPYT